MKAEVRAIIDIPPGYQLAETYMRKANIGETVLYPSGEVGVVDAATDQEFPILIRAWEPTGNKMYMFSDNIEDVGTHNGVCALYKEYNHDSLEYPYVSTYGDYSYCWIIPDYLIGK